MKLKIVKQRCPNLKNLHKDKNIWIVQIDSVTLWDALGDMFNERRPGYGVMISYS